ncbi:hypothetical protein AB0K15_29540 [Amycolatopsis sp. NPDC049253]|uniref:hypothetical protein n=1 Tax=Amycolatopsis sp. NPDC049253 TaxID=3155274 RepID=UPI003434C832
MAASSAAATQHAAGAPAAKNTLPSEATPRVAPSCCTALSRPAAEPVDLHRYLTQRLGTIEGIRTCETAPVLRTLKSASPIGPPLGA